MLKSVDNHPDYFFYDFIERYVSYNQYLVIRLYYPFKTHTHIHTRLLT